MIKISAKERGYELSFNNIKILHLSDFHFEKKNTEQDNKFSSLLNAIKKENGNAPFDYIFITGDIINKGQTENYKTALEYLKDFIKELNIDSQKIFIVPGNHDNNFNLKFEEEDKIRKSLTEATFDNIQNIESETDEILAKTEQRQKCFFNFLKSLKINTTIPICTSDNNNAYIICLNSAIFSAINDHRNQIYFINKQIENIINNTDFKDKKVFILSHHPIDYFEENTKDKILTFARKHNAFIFSGHSHIHAYEKQFRDDETAHQFWCGNFQSNDASFNIIEIDYTLAAFRLRVLENKKDEWHTKQFFADKIKDNQSDILSFLMDAKKEQDKLKQFKMLWNKLFDSPVLVFEKFWEESSLLITKYSDRKIRANIKNQIYSGSECCLLYLLFQNINNYRAVKLFRDIPINLDKLNRNSKNIYKRELLNTAAFLYPELFRYP